MRYTVNSEVFKLDSRLQFGILIGRGLKNTETSLEDAARLRTAENLIRQMILVEELRNHPTIQNYRSTMERVGINPNKYPASIEAMFKRVLKGNPLPNINALVDLCNVVSLENQIALGGHDFKDIQEDLTVRFTRGTERFLPFGAMEYENVEAGELVLTSGDVIQTRNWIWRQSELGKMTLDTQDVFFQLVGFEDLSESSLVNALDALEELIVDRFKGQCQRFIVNQCNPEIEF